MILHIDMDAFFASVEQRDSPELKGKPVAVGGSSNRSVVAAASYEARAFGVHSAMPVFQALRLCPQLILVPVDKPRYKAVSDIIMNILGTFSPLMEQVSVDEAFLDISGCTRLLGSNEAIAHAIKKAIANETGLTCSIGAAPAKFLAKIASDINKPDGLFIIEPDQALDFARNVDIRKVPGVGKRAMEQMKRLGIKTLGDVKRFRPELVIRTFGKFGCRLLEFADATDCSGVDATEQRKSISSESTLAEDTCDKDAIKQQLLAHSQTVGVDLRKKNYYAGNVVLKIKFADFSHVTRQKKLDRPSCASSAIYAEAVSLMETIRFDWPVRLTGVGVSTLVDSRKPRQLDLFTSSTCDENKWEKVDRTLDTISERFGRCSVGKASLNHRLKGSSLTGKE